MTQDHAAKAVFLVYDGECPLCRNYVRYARISGSVENFTLVNGREPHPIIDEIKQKSLDLNEGIVLKVDDVFYHGDEAMHVLALMSTRSGLFNKINYAVFKNPKTAKFIYPILRCGRNLLLKILGVGQI